MNIIITISILNIALYLAIALLALWVWNQGKAQRRFFFLMLVSVCWFINVLLEAIIRDNFQLYALLSKFDFTFAALVSYNFLLFAFHFPKTNLKFSITKEILSFIPILVLIFLTFWGLMFKVINFDQINFNVPLYLVYIITLIIYFIILGAGNLIIKFKNSIGLLRLQLKYVIFGYIISIVCLLYLSIQNALFARLTDRIFLGTIAVGMIFPIAIAYAVLKYRLMDIRFVIRRGIVHIVSVIIIVALYTYLVLFVQDYFKADKTFTTLMSVLVIALTIYPFRKWLFKAIDQLFYKKEIERNERINELVSKLPAVKEYEDIQKDIYSVIAEKFKIEDIRIMILDRKRRIFETTYPFDARKITIPDNDYLIRHLAEKTILVREEIPYLIEKVDEPEKIYFKDLELELKTLRAEVIVALKYENVQGLILLGHKKSKNAYTVQDINFLTKLSQDAGLGLANVLLYKETIEGLKRGIERGEIGS